MARRVRSIEGRNRFEPDDRRRYLTGPGKHDAGSGDENRIRPLPGHRLVDAVDAGHAVGPDSCASERDRARAVNGLIPGDAERTVGKRSNLRMTRIPGARNALPGLETPPIAGNRIEECQRGFRSPRT